MNFRTRRAIEHRTRSVLFNIRYPSWPWDEYVSAQWQRKGQYVRLRLPSRTRCMATRRRNLRLRWDDRADRAHVMPWSSSSFTAHVLLRTPVRDTEALRLFVEQAIVRRVRIIAAVGCKALKTEGEVDYIIVGDRFEQSRFIATTAHATSRDAIGFIASTFGVKRFFEVWL